MKATASHILTMARDLDLYVDKDAKVDDTIISILDDDSLTYLEFIVDLECEYNVTIPDEALDPLNTPIEIASFIDKLQREQPSEN